MSCLLYINANFRFFIKKPRNVKCLVFCIRKRNRNCLVFWKVSGFSYIKTFHNCFCLIYIYKRARCISLMTGIVILIYIQKAFFLRNFFIHKKQKKKSFLRTIKIKNPNTESSLEQLKRNFAFSKKINNSIATKLCAILINVRRKKIRLF